MSTECIRVSLEDDPLEVLKGCSSIMSCLDESFADNIYNYQAIKIIADILTDAVSRLDDEDFTVSKNGIGTNATKWGKYN